MSYGMGYDEFWTCSPERYKAYKDMHLLKLKQMNEQIWLQGAYICEAFGVNLANAFGGRGQPKQTYTKKPYDVFPKTEYEKEAETENLREQTIINMQMMFGRFKKEGKDNG